MEDRQWARMWPVSKSMLEEPLVFFAHMNTQPIYPTNDCYMYSILTNEHGDQKRKNMGEWKTTK